MIHTGLKSNTRLKTFIFENNINQSQLHDEYIDKEYLKQDKLSLSWRSLSDIVHGKRSPTLKFMKQIRSGMSLYLDRRVEMIELFEIDTDD